MRVKKNEAQVAMGVRRRRDDFTQTWEIWEGTLIALWEILAPLHPASAGCVSLSFFLLESVHFGASRNWSCYSKWRLADEN